MKKFQEPVVEVILLEAKDIVTVSDPASDPFGADVLDWE